MAFRSLPSLVRNTEDLPALEVAELAGVLLIHLKSYEGMHGNSVYQNGKLNQTNFLAQLEANPGPGRQWEYGDKQPEVSRALMEAWNWLEREGFLIRAVNQPGYFFWVSRRGQRVTSRDDFEAYRKASVLPKAQLHAVISGKVYPAFLRGDYDTAVS